jgi:hypothetical protein
LRRYRQFQVKLPDIISRHHANEVLRNGTPPERGAETTGVMPDGAA